MLALAQAPKVVSRRLFPSSLVGLYGLAQEFILERLDCGNFSRWPHGEGGKDSQDNKQRQGEPVGKKDFKK
jgi:hypothetical protein